MVRVHLAHLARHRVCLGLGLKHAKERADLVAVIVLDYAAVLGLQHHINREFPKTHQGRVTFALQLFDLSSLANETIFQSLEVGQLRLQRIHLFLVALADFDQQLGVGLALLGIAGLVVRRFLKQLQLGFLLGLQVGNLLGGNFHFAGNLLKVEQGRFHHGQIGTSLLQFRNLGQPRHLRFGQHIKAECSGGVVLLEQIDLVIG